MSFLAMISASTPDVSTTLRYADTAKSVPGVIATAPPEATRTACPAVTLYSDCTTNAAFDVVTWGPLRTHRRGAADVDGEARADGEGSAGSLR